MDGLKIALDDCRDSPNEYENRLPVEIADRRGHYERIKEDIIRLVRCFVDVFNE